MKLKHHTEMSNNLLCAKAEVVSCNISSNYGESKYNFILFVHELKTDTKSQARYVEMLLNGREIKTLVRKKTNTQISRSIRRLCSVFRNKKSENFSEKNAYVLSKGEMHLPVIQ